MPLSNDFKAKIKDGKIKEALEMALAEAVELKITTWVTQEGQENGSASAEVSPSQRLETRINLLSNEIATEVGQEFADGGVYSQLKAFHQEQVNQSHRLIQNNINCLQRLLSLWGRLDPAIAASIPALEDSAIESRQPLLIGDDADFSSNVLPASSPTVASSIAETPIVSVPPVEVAAEAQPVAESSVLPDRDSLLEDEYRGLETSKLGTTPESELLEDSATTTPAVPAPETDTPDDSSGINLPGIAAAAGVGMLGMNLYQSFQNRESTDEEQPESPEVESLFNAEADSPLAEPVNPPADLDLFSDLSTPPAETASDDAFFSPSSSEFDFSAAAPAIEPMERPSSDSLISSGWNDESWVQSEIPSAPEQNADEIATSHPDTLDVNWDEASFTPATDDLDLSSWTAEAPSTTPEELEASDNWAVSGWSDETGNQADVPSLQDFSAGEMPTPSADLGAANWDDETFVPANLETGENAHPAAEDIDLSIWTQETEASTIENLGTEESAAPVSENAAVSGWSDETENQADVPSQQDFSAGEMPTPSTDLAAANWDDESFVPSNFGDLGTAEIAPPISENADLSSWTVESETPAVEDLRTAEVDPTDSDRVSLSGWDDETWTQADVSVPQDSSSGEMPTPSTDLIGANWDDETFVPSNLGDLGTAEIAPPISENADLSSWTAETPVIADWGTAESEDVSLSGWSEDTLPQVDVPASSDASVGETSADESFGLFESEETVESFDDLAAPEVDVFAEAGDEEAESMDRVASPPTDDLAIASPEVSEPGSASDDLDFNLPGAAVLGGLGVAGLGIFAAQSHAEEATLELPQTESLTPPASDTAEVPDTISSLDELVFDDSSNAEADLASVPEDAIFSSNEAPGADNFDLPQESADSLFDEAQMSDWASASNLETPSEVSEADLASWTFGDATPAPSEPEVSEADLASWTFGDATPAVSEASASGLETPQADLASWTFGDATPAPSELEVSEADLASWTFGDATNASSDAVSEASASGLETPQADLASWTFGDSTPAPSELEVSEADLASWTFGDATPAPSEPEVSEADLASWTFGDATSASSELPEASLETLSESPEVDMASWTSELSDVSLETISESSDSDLGAWDLGDISDINAEPTEIEMPKWDLADSAPTAAEPPVAADELASWQNEDLSLSSDWGANDFNLDLPANGVEGLGSEVSQLTSETYSTSELEALDSVLGSEGDLSGWEIESSLPAETQIDSELDALIGAEDLDEFNLPTPEAWDNWQDEQVREDSIAALERLSNDPNPLDLGSLGSEAGSWDLSGEGDKLADPFASANLEGIDDWQLVVPETSQASADRPAEDLDLFLNSPESDKFPTDSKNAATPDALSLDDELSLWGSEEDPFADIFSMESSESTEKQK